MPYTKPRALYLSVCERTFVMGDAGLQCDNGYCLRPSPRIFPMVTAFDRSSSDRAGSTYYCSAPCFCAYSNTFNETHTLLLISRFSFIILYTSS